MWYKLAQNSPGSPYSMSTASPEWLALRKEARAAESEIEQYIQSFSRISVANDSPSEPLDEGVCVLRNESSSRASEVSVFIV